MHDETPEWEIARTAPLEFFGLEPGCSRVELRRRYAAMLRRYKPEAYPVEFQEIRAAFEAADLLHRDDSFELRAEVVVPSKPPAVAPHVEVIQQRRRDSNEIRPEVILESARRLRNDQFYEVAQDDLLEYIRNSPFDDWSRLLQKISGFVDDHDYRNLPYGKVQFLIYLLPFAMWKSPDHWIRCQSDFLADNADLVLDEHGYEFLLQLLGYRRKYPSEDYPELLEAFHPLHQHIVELLSQPMMDACRNLRTAHEALIAPGGWFEQVLARRIQNAIEVQLKIWEAMLSHAQSVLSSHSIEEPTGIRSEEEYFRFLETCRDPLRQSREYRKFRRSMTQSYTGSHTLLLMVSLGIAIGTGFGGYVLATNVFDGLMENEPTETLGKLVSIAVGCFVFFRIRQGGTRTLQSDQFHYEHRVMEHSWIDWYSVYREKIRPLLFDYLRDSNLTWRDLRFAFCHRIEKTAKALGVAPEIVQIFYRQIESDPLIRCCVAGASLRLVQRSDTNDLE